jgi:carboxynorspermidine decarboxylase
LSEIRAPYYLIDERRLLRNLETIKRVRDESGAKSVLALKCFAMWSTFDLISQYLDGTTSSSLNEARLGCETFGKETHAYAVAWTADEVREVATFADKVIFNSASQLHRLHHLAAGCVVGLRVNPGISYSHFDLADPGRRYSRLGVIDIDELRTCLDHVSGLMFHFNCENEDVSSVEHALEVIGSRYGDELSKMEWVSLGGGISFTQEGYDVSRFCTALRQFAEKFGVQLYLEPGDAVITGTAEFVTTVLDVVHNEVDIAIVNASVEAHMPDHLVYGTTLHLNAPASGSHKVIIAGRTCLAGDSFGEHFVATPLVVGDEVRFADAAGYTMVKKSWFNGDPMPSIVIQRLDGTQDDIREFGYDDYKNNLS